MDTQVETHYDVVRLKSLPKLSGVYLMKDRDGTVLYVGKAKDLRARVRSYFSGGDGRYRIKFLVTKVYDIETLVTEDERQALVLESDLIKKYKPQYNVRLKDDKAYLVIRVDLSSEWPRLELLRKVQDDGAKYFGPYAFGYEVRTMLNVIKRIFPLRTCSDRVMCNRVRPCLEYQIKRCAGPCCLDVDKSKYLDWVSQSMLVLEGKNSEVLQLLREDMEHTSSNLLFEEAARIRDSIEVLEKVAEEHPRYAVVPGSRDAIGLYREGSCAEFSVLMVRQGRLQDSRTFGFWDLDIPDDELLENLLSQYYSNVNVVPDEILVPFALEDFAVREELLTDRRGAKVTFHVPKRGHKVKLLNLAEANAKENFRARFVELGNERLLSALQNDLSLAELPKTIECVDVSHFQGSGTVASVVFFEDGVPDKTRYRHFRLSQEGKPDDFASMREVIGRHLSRCAEENSLCDLLIVDGGPAQLSQAVRERDALSLSVPELVGLAKKRSGREQYKIYQRKAAEMALPKPERVYKEGAGLPIILKPNSDALLLLERIRDEAHRFAITFHRKIRAKAAFRSALDEIPGVGPKRKKHLLRAFGSIKAIREASSDELQSRCSLPVALAERISAMLRQKENK